MPTKPIYFPILFRRGKYSSQKKYTGFREEIREDCQFRCGYCDIHEHEMGGEKSMTMDHFRPKSKYKNLIRDPFNLIWSCFTCNQLKGNDWPAFGKTSSIVGKVGYIDPFIENRSSYYDIQVNGRLRPLKDPADYMIQMLALDRPFLRLVRQKRNVIYQSLQEFENYFLGEIFIEETLLKKLDMVDPNKKYLEERLEQLRRMLEIVERLDRIFQLP